MRVIKRPTSDMPHCISRITSLITSLSVLILFISGCSLYKNTKRETHFHKLPSPPPYPVFISSMADCIDTPDEARADCKPPSRFPAPRIININGTLGGYRMDSFSRFLIKMGYPYESLLNPLNGHLSYSGFIDSRTLAGLFAWFYEKDGMRPVLIGHSRGGMKVVEVLREFEVPSCTGLRPWNPVTGGFEDRKTITDPFTKKPRSLCNLGAGFASAVSTGSLMRILLFEWGSLNWMRDVPAGVERFLGIFIKGDLIGADPLGLGPYRTGGKGIVRNIHLKGDYHHIDLFETEYIPDDPNAKSWVDGYMPEGEKLNEPRPTLPDQSNIVIAAELWYEIKLNWVRELKRLYARKTNETEG